MPKEKKTENKCDLDMDGHQVRIALTNGAWRAGTIIKAYDDVILLEAIDGQTGIINRRSILEIWEGLGEAGEEPKEGGGKE